MPATTVYDPDTLAFLADQAAYGPTGKKHYNPVPHSRIPSTPRPKAASSAARPAPPPHTAPLPTDPVYLLSVPPGHERAIAARLAQFSAASGVWEPVTASGEPMLPGSLFVAIPDAVKHEVLEQIRERQWGWVSKTQADADLVRAFLPYAASLAAVPDPWGPHHPIRVIAEAVLHRRGWHGTLREKGWALKTVHGAPIVDADFQNFWQALVAEWTAHRSVSALAIRHRADLVGAAYPVTLDGTLGRHDWPCRWLGVPARIPAAAHRHIRPRARTVWAVLTQAEPLTFSLTHPDLLRHRLRYRLPYLDAVREPGRWAAILVPRMTDVVARQVRSTARSLGWAESWRAVCRDDPAGVLRVLLNPQDAIFDRTTGQARIRGVPADREPWLDTARAWLPQWTLVLGR